MGNHVQICIFNSRIYTARKVIDYIFFTFSPSEPKLKEFSEPGRLHILTWKRDLLSIEKHYLSFFFWKKVTFSNLTKCHFFSSYCLTQLSLNIYWCIWFLILPLPSWLDIRQLTMLISVLSIHLSCCSVPDIHSFISVYRMSITV